MTARRTRLVSPEAAFAFTRNRMKQKSPDKSYDPSCESLTYGSDFVLATFLKTRISDGTFKTYKTSLADWSVSFIWHGGSMSQTIRVLVADDHPMVRECISRILESEDDLQVVGKASNGVAAIEMAVLCIPMWS